jgi:hypothetical protein
MRNAVLVAAAMAALAVLAASEASAHRQQSHSSSIDAQCNNILANPEGYPGSVVTYCRKYWVHAPLRFWSWGHWND